MPGAGDTAVSRTDGVLTTDAQPHMGTCVHTGRSRNPGRGWPCGPGGVPGSQQYPALCGAPALPRRRPGAGTDRDDGGAGVLQVQEQGHHALVHLGSQPAQLLACHRRHQVPKQCHGRCPDPVPLLQDRGLEPSQTQLKDSRFLNQNPKEQTPQMDVGPSVEPSCCRDKWKRLDPGST